MSWSRLSSPAVAVVLLPTLLALPVTRSDAQAQRGVLLPAGARVKVEAPGSGGTEGTVLAARGDTLLVRADAGGDTVRLATARVTNLRVVESPALWRYRSASDLNFYVYVSSPRGTGPDAYVELLLVATGTELAALDPATGTPVWTRQDLPNLKGNALDVVGATGYGVITRGEKMEVIDLRSGETRWDTSALSMLAARGWLWLPSADTAPSLLMLGRTARSGSSLLAVDLTTGKARWQQDSLFTIEPRVFGAGGIPYLLGHQTPLRDTDTTLVLYINTEGPMRLDARTGAILWKADALRDAKIPLPRDGYARIVLRRGLLFVPSEKQLVALGAADGRPAWSAPRPFKSQVIRMEVTRQGLLARGDDWIDLLDPADGKSGWRAPVALKNSTRFVTRGDTVFVAADKKVLAIPLASGAPRTLATVSFKEGESPTGFGILDVGLVLNSWHNLMLVDRGGAVQYHVVYPSPKQNFGELLRQGGGESIRRPTTRWGGSHIYFFTGAADAAGREGFSVVNLDAETGREASRVWLSERSPLYLLETTSGLVLQQRDDRELAAFLFGDAQSLAHAARHGRARVVERLLDMGVDPNAATPGRWTALHVAARGGHAEIVGLLLARGARADPGTDGGWTPWMLATREGHAGVAHQLREAGAAASEATAGMLNGWHLATQGRIDDAMAALAAAQALDSALVLWPAAWLTLCWQGVLAARAADVLAACDRAADRESGARFVRGIARALTGNLEGAATDLEASLDVEEEDSAVQQWIDALRGGRNPITPEVLAYLRRR